MEVLNASLAKNMAEDGSDLCVYRGVDYSYGWYSVAFVVVFFQFVNWIIKTIGPPKSLLDDEWKWRNLTISYLHALACVLWAVACFVIQPELMSDLQYFKTHLIICLVTFSTGYFIYDFLDLALSGKMFTMWEVQLHHIAVGMMFYYDLARCEWLGFNLIALLVEVNSFFLHQRKLLQMLGTPFDAPLYRVTIFLNLASFSVFRTVPLAAILWGMVVLYHQVERYYFACLCCSMFVMVGMNPILFMRLLRSDYLRDGHQGKRQRNMRSAVLGGGGEGMNGKVGAGTGSGSGVGAAGGVAMVNGINNCRLLGRSVGGEGGDHSKQS